MSTVEYTYEAMWSPEDHVFIARVSEFPALVAHGTSRGASLRALRSVVDAVVKELIASGIEPPKQATGAPSKATTVAGDEEALSKFEIRKKGKKR